MKYTLLSFMVCSLMLFGCSGQAEEQKPATEKEKASYSIGVNIGSNIKQESLDLDQELLIRGIKDALAGTTTLMTQEEMQASLETLQKDLSAKKEAQQKVASEKNAKDGETFLSENSKKEGIVTLPSGVQYKIITTGTGAKPKASDTVTTHYKGTLIDGTVFDSSYERGQPATFPVGGVIAGWTEVLQMMPVGSKWQVFIPAKLAYGEKGAGNVIGPNSTLIFEIELISIQGQ